MENAWRQLEWNAAARARAVALACRLDRQLEQVAAVASRPESRLANRLRTELQVAVEGAPSTDGLFATVEAIHEQVTYLPKLGMPTGVRVFLRSLFGASWDDDVVVAALPAARWPRTHATESDVAGASPRPKRPVAVIPQAETGNPLMWPLVALQGASIVGWSDDGEERVRELAGPGVFFAMAESMMPDAVSAGDATARLRWQRGRDELVGAGVMYEDAMELARHLADGILISARRVGSDDIGSDIYAQLVAVRDVPADAREILSAGWIHWYGHAVPRLLDATDWAQRREIVDGVDDVLCRSLDVAAIHRFYATEGAST